MVRGNGDQRPPNCRELARLVIWYSIRTVRGALDRVEVSPAGWRHRAGLQPPTRHVCDGPATGSWDQGSFEGHDQVGCSGGGLVDAWLVGQAGA